MGSALTSARRKREITAGCDWPARCISVVQVRPLHATTVIVLGLAACHGDILGGGSGGDAAGPDDQTVDPTGCGRVSLDLMREPPTVILLIDQSSSMSLSFGGTSRWSAVYS